MFRTKDTDWMNGYKSQIHIHMLRTRDPLQT